MYNKYILFLIQILKIFRVLFKFHYKISFEVQNIIILFSKMYVGRCKQKKSMERRNWDVQMSDMSMYRTFWKFIS